MRSFHKFEAQRLSWFYWYVATRELAVRSQRATRELGVEAPACARAPRPCPSCPLPCCPCPRPSCPRPGESLAVRPRSPPDSPGQVLLLLLALAEPRLPAEGAFSPRVARRLGVEAPVIHFCCFKLQAYSVFLGSTPWPQHCKRIPCCLYDSGQRLQALYSQVS